MSVQRAARAGAWSALDIVLRQGVQFVVSIILARLLSPADFGLIALLTFFTSLSITFVQGGLSVALVQRQETTLEQESAVFWCNFAASLVFGALLCLISPALARFYDLPLLEPLMFAAAAQVVLSALGAVQTALLSRELRFDQLTLSGILSALGSGAAGVTAAMMGYGVWALAIQLVSQAAIATLVLWFVSSWRPVLRFRLSTIRELAGFGFFVSISSVLDSLYNNGFALVIGKAYGVVDLGLLNRASGVQALPTNVISQIIARTALPLFASRASDKDALLRGFRASVSFTMLLTTPMLVGLALLAELVIRVLFGEKWLGAAPLLSIIAIGGALMPLHVFNLQLLLAQGRSKRFLKVELQKKAFGVVCIGLGCLQGIEGVAWATVVFNAVAFLINAWPTRETLGHGAWRQILDLRGIAAATAFMSVAVGLARHFVALPPLPELIFLVGVGTLAYMGFGLGLRLASFRNALGTVQLAIARGEPLHPELNA